jgi:putative glutamine amidotransferase
MRPNSKRPTVAITYSSANYAKFDHWSMVFESVAEAGATPVTIDCADVQATFRSLSRGMDGLILAGGGDVDPRRYGADANDPMIWEANPVHDSGELEAFDLAQKAGIPVLAICRGAQLVNVSLGGSLWVDLARDRPNSIGHWAGDDHISRPFHDVEVAEGSVLARWMGQGGRIPANAQHHQGMRKIAAELTETAWTSDGLVEGYECLERNLVGVQWHPELLWEAEPSAAALMAGFVEGCRG